MKLLIETTWKFLNFSPIENFRDAIAEKLRNSLKHDNSVLCSYACFQFENKSEISFKKKFRLLRCFRQKIS